MIRNQFMAETLWFLTCLFVMQVIFAIIKKLKYKLLIFVVCLGLYYVTIRLFPVSPAYAPTWCYNADSALHFMIYYAIGYLAYPYIEKLFQLDTWKKKLIYGITGLMSLCYSIQFFFGVDLLSGISFPIFAYAFTPVLVTCIMIWSYFVFARLLQDVKGLEEIGKNTLYLCGSEYIAKILITSFFAIFGIGTTIYDSVRPLMTYLYVGFLLFVTNKYIVPTEKYILNKLIKK